MREEERERRGEGRKERTAPGVAAPSARQRLRKREMERRSGEWVCMDTSKGIETVRN